MAQGKFIDKTGEENINNQGLKMKIIKYNGYYNVIVRFETGDIVKTQYGHFKRGDIKLKGYEKVFGIGNTNGMDTHNKSWECWYGMFERCYCPKLKKRRPSYEGCTVDDKWINYKDFKKWYDEHYYEIDGERMNLDKDILIKGNKIYSPETCIFVPQRINTLFTKSNNTRGECPIGVSKYNNKYITKLSIDGKVKILGHFNTPEEAFYVYKEAKEKEIKRVADLYKDKMPQKVYKAMYSYEVEITD